MPLPFCSLHNNSRTPPSFIYLSEEHVSKEPVSKASITLHAVSPAHDDNTLRSDIFGGSSEASSSEMKEEFDELEEDSDEEEPSATAGTSLAEGSDDDEVAASPAGTVQRGVPSRWCDEEDGKLVSIVDSIVGAYN